MSLYFDATRPESDLDSQDARGPASSALLPLSTLLSLPPNLLLIRQQAFQLHAELIWTADECQGPSLT